VRSRTARAIQKNPVSEKKNHKENGQVTYQGVLIKIILHFSPETMKARRFWVDVFEKIDKIHKSLARMTRGHRDYVISNKIRNEKGDITTEPEIPKHPQKAILNKNRKSELNGQFPRQIPGTKIKTGSN
jgi:hypothetical protein